MNTSDLDKRIELALKAPGAHPIKTRCLRNLQGEAVYRQWAEDSGGSELVEFEGSYAVVRDEHGDELGLKRLSPKEMLLVALAPGWRLYELEPRS